MLAALAALALRRGPPRGLRCGGEMVVLLWVRVVWCEELLLRGVAVRGGVAVLGVWHYCGLLLLMVLRRRLVLVLRRVRVVGVRLGGMGGHCSGSSASSASLSLVLRKMYVNALWSWWVVWRGCSTRRNLGQGRLYARYVCCRMGARNPVKRRSYLCESQLQRDVRLKAGFADPFV